MQPTRDPFAPADQDIMRSEDGDEGEAVATIAMTALPFQGDAQGDGIAPNEEAFAQASTIDIKGDEVESWLQQAQQAKAPDEAEAEARGKEFRTMVESPAVASVPNAVAVKAPGRMSRPTHPTMAEAPPVSVAAAPPVQAPPPAHASATVADMQAFTPPPKRPAATPQPSGAPPWTIAVIGVLVVAIIVTLLALLGVF